ncbi:MAG: DUF2911 domain-containing protein, partial [Myxococcales bacterium]|nr:DUF2911 domain-containing protein [Myxococcales bacterium]
TVSQMVGATQITVTYSSPAKRDRKIFGELVPFGELWRTGANGATTLETSDAITVGGQAVPAGKYAVFTVPGEGEWTVILNKNPNQGGTRQYDQKLDQARFTVKPAEAPARERMTFLFADTTDDAANLDLEWGTTRVRLPIKVDTQAIVQAQITAYQKKAARNLANAGRHLAGSKDAKGALALYDAALATERTWFALWLKASLLAEQGDYKAAYPLAEEAYALGKKDDYFFWEAQVAQALKDWKGKKSKKAKR